MHRIRQFKAAIENHPVVVSHRKASELLASRGFKRGEFGLLPNGDVAAVIDGNNAYNYSQWRLLRYEDLRRQFNALDFYKLLKRVCAEIDRQRKDRQKRAETPQISISGFKWIRLNPDTESAGGLK